MSDGAEAAPATAAPPRRTEKEIENSTLAMLQAFRTARSVPGKELLRLIDEHAYSCEEYAQVLPQAWGRVSKLTAALRADLRGSGFKEHVPVDAGTSGIFSEFLSSLGVATDSVPTAPQAVLSTPAVTQTSEPVEKAAELAAVLDHLEQGPAKALQEGRRLEAELKEMVKLLERLRAIWPELRTSVEGAFEKGTHLRTKDIAQALKQVLQFRRQLCAATPSIEALCDLLEDATEQVRQREEERLRFKAMTREVLDGQSKALAARVAAVLWLKRGKASSARPEQTRFDIEQASEALERNLEAAKDMESRLVKGAGTVMKREACHQVVQRTVARLSVLRGKVLSAAEAVSAARADLAGARRSGQAALTEAAAIALEQLIAAFDEAASHVDAGGGRGAPRDPQASSGPDGELTPSPSAIVVTTKRTSQQDVLEDLAKSIGMTGKPA
ncbi:unnamed protein product [Effrenium voratum]|uniref:Uncharacterized protein n=1 Tax=Effrenium voratum TaxID=2562239 RepID=A0AA36HXB2_9DINO|nr:unnamed protein product [Effrenium voratum]CAJ1377052.1 unnamed protein product [Effrenium voratum]